MSEALSHRQCGDCQACCVVFEIRELQKPPGTPCVHLKGHGCSIYDHRPSVCRSWLCGWRLMPELPEDWRPDMSGILVYQIAEERPGYTSNAMIVSLSRGLAHIGDENLMGFVLMALMKHQQLYLGTYSDRANMKMFFLNPALEPAIAARDQAGFAAILKAAIEEVVAADA